MNFQNTFVGLVIAGTLLPACASQKPSTELMTARQAFIKAENSQTAKLSPVALREAERTLNEAERAHKDEPRSAREQHLGYIALRQVEHANAKAAAEQAQLEQARAQSTYESALEKEVRKKRVFASNLREAQKQLTELRSQKEAQGERLSAELMEKEKALAAHVAMLQAAEQRVAEARKMLAEMAQVKEEQQRLHITLSGAVLFKTGSAELLPMAQDSLNTVADALEGYQTPSIVVEGHTDSRGTELFNRELSQKRAESVRQYLVSRGIPAEQVKAVGKGEASPVADNNSPEGRANNRLVAIIVDHQGKVADATSAQN